jgi:hypothetical protein
MIHNTESVIRKDTDVGAPNTNMWSLDNSREQSRYMGCQWDRHENPRKRVDETT